MSHNFVSTTPQRQWQLPPLANVVRFALLHVVIFGALHFVLNAIWNVHIIATALITLAIATLIVQRKLAMQDDAQERNSAMQLPISTDAQDLQLMQLQLDDHESQLQALRLALDMQPSQLQAQDRASNFVAVQVNPVRQQALGWVIENLYRDGTPNADALTDTGIIKVQVPWSARGAWNAKLSRDGKQYLVDAKIIHEGAGGRFTLDTDHFPTAGTVGKIK